MLKKQDFYKNMSIMKDYDKYDFPVDLVYLWVDGNETEWLKRRNIAIGNFQQLDESSTNKCRFVDNEELRYSLRSVHKFCNWINHIFIVTDGQRPKWLKNSEKITIIDHSDIMPKEALPCFNSVAIETCIPFIPNLSEHYIYSNDDHFFAGCVDKSFFFNEEGYPIFRLRHKLDIQKINHNYHRMIYNATNLISEKFGITYNNITHHNVDSYKKQDVKDCIEIFKKEIDKTTYSQFRQDFNIERSVYLYYAAAIKHAEVKILSEQNGKLSFIHKFFYKLLNLYQLDSNVFSVSKINQIPRKIKKYNSKLFSINDTEETTDLEREKIQPFLEEYFPEKSPYEL